MKSLVGCLMISKMKRLPPILLKMIMILLQHFKFDVGKNIYIRPVEDDNDTTAV